MRPLSELADKIMVGIASAATHAYRDFGVPMLRNQNIREGKVDDSSLLFIDPKYEETHKNKRLKAGDVLTVRTGYPGLSAVVPKKYENAQCFTSLITRPKKDLLDADYLCAFINSPIGKRFILGAEAGGAQKNVNAGTLETLEVLLPPLEEQKKIAEILSTWDRAIENVKNLLNENERLMNGALQIIPNFSNKPNNRWTLSLLHELGHFSKGKGIAKDEIVESGSPCIRYADIYTKHHYVVKNFSSFISRESCENAKRIHKNDLLFAGSGETLEEIGKSVAFIGDEVAYTGGDTIVFSPLEIDAVFLSFLLNSPYGRRQIHTRGQGHTVVHVYSSDLESIEVIYPRIDEQKKISTALLAIDKTIEKLNQVKSLLVLQKRALVQKLVTGTIRVKV